MTLLDALILGIVEGITEYLPVSSTGHLLLTQRLLGIPQTASANAFAIVIQLGAIIAVFAVFAKRMRSIARGMFGRDEEGRRLGLNIFVAFLPAAVIGLLFDDMIERYLFGLPPIIMAWAIGALVILVLEKRLRTGNTIEINNITIRIALIIGFAQCFALIPGTSRSLATIVGGVLAGLSLLAAVEFSFLLGLLTLGAATVYKALQFGPQMIAEFGALQLAVGVLSSTVSAFLAVRWMIGFLQNRGMRLFAYWRLAAAIFAAGMLHFGYLTP